MDVIRVVMRAFCVHRMNWAAALWVVLCKLPMQVQNLDSKLWTELT